MRFRQLQKGPENLVRLLNRLIQELNRISPLCSGDDVLRVNPTQNGTILSVDIWALSRKLAKLMKQGGGTPGTPVLLAKIVSVGSGTLTCYEAIFNGTEWGVTGSPFTVYPYPNFGSNLSHYKVNTFINVIKVGEYWVAAYSQPTAFQEYSS